MKLRLRILVGTEEEHMPPSGLSLLRQAELAPALVRLATCTAA